MHKSINQQTLTTCLTGRSTVDGHADFEFNEEGTKVIRCAGGHAPKACSYMKSSDQSRASFPRSVVRVVHTKMNVNRSCINKQQLNKYLFKSKARAIGNQFRKTDEFRVFAAIRNGIESIPST